MKAFFLIAVVLTIGLSRLDAQSDAKSGVAPAEQLYMATVRVLAFEAGGTFLGPPEVRVFEAEDHKNIAGAFHQGMADHVPFGVYRIEAYLNGFYPEVRDVSVYRPQVTIIVGLSFGREAMALPMPPSLHGRVVGSLPPSKKTFVRLTGLYSSHSLETSIDSGGAFDFGVPWDGRYLLIIVNENGVLASRTIEIPYKGPPLEIAFEAK